MDFVLDTVAFLRNTGSSSGGGSDGGQGGPSEALQLCYCVSMLLRHIMGEVSRAVPDK